MNLPTNLLAVVLSALLIAPPVPGQPGPAADAPITADPVLQLRFVATDAGALRVNSRSAQSLAIEVTDAGGNPVPDAAVVFRLPDSGATGAFPDGSHAMVKYTDASGRAEAPAIAWSATPGTVSIRITAVKGAGHAGLLVEKELTSDGLPVSERRAPVVSPANGKTPGVLKPAARAEEAGDDDTAAPSDTEMDARQIARSGAASVDSPAQGTEPPSVSITSASPAGGPHLRAKWIILAGLAAAAGVGAMMALHGSGGSSAAPPAPGLSIGSPSISIGHP